MKSTYIIERVNDYLYLTVSGEYDFADFEAYIKIIHERCEEGMIYKILFDAFNVKGIDIPTMERYFLGIEVAEHLAYRIKLAVVWHKEFINHFGETVAKNRGADIGVFGNMEAALQWLIPGNP
jgi:hypothetical protein